MSDTELYTTHYTIPPAIKDIVDEETTGETTESQHPDTDTIPFEYQPDMDEGEPPYSPHPQHHTIEPPVSISSPKQGLPDACFKDKRTLMTKLKDYTFRYQYTLAGIGFGTMLIGIGFKIMRVNKIN